MRSHHEALENHATALREQSEVIQEMARAMIKIVSTIREGYVGDEEWTSLHQIAGIDFGPASDPNIGDGSGI